MLKYIRFIDLLCYGRWRHQL